MIKTNDFYFADHLSNLPLSLFVAAQILHLIRRMNRAVLRAKILCYSYRMNKVSWISATLDGSVPAETIELLLDVSYELTKPKPRRKTAKGKENE